jgi:hypothetical protein
MLTVTENAAVALRAAMAQAEVPQPSGSGIRISARSVRVSGTSGRPRLELSAVHAREAGDEVVMVPGGPPLFLAQLVVPLLADKVLDGSVDRDGHPLFHVTGAITPRRIPA